MLIWKEETLIYSFGGISWETEFRRSGSLIIQSIDPKAEKNTKRNTLGNNPVLADRWPRWLGAWSCSPYAPRASPALPPWCWIKEPDKCKGANVKHHIQLAVDCPRAGNTEDSYSTLLQNPHIGPSMGKVLSGASGSRVVLEDRLQHTVLQSFWAVLHLIRQFREQAYNFRNIWRWVQSLLPNDHIQSRGEGQV